MKVPYSQVHVHGPVIFAARSGWIDSFNVQDGNHISTWKHPDSTNVEKTEERDGDAAAEPPSKRQKTSEAEDVSTLKTADVAQDGNGETGSAEKGQNSKKAKAAPKSQMSRAPDRPVVIQLTGTSDGKHIVAVTGHDKAIWVFEHDGEGHLKQLGKRSASFPFQ
jgi:tRNA (guanine-N(7)-)-methyltransferase subunit TRM82